MARTPWKAYEVKVLTEYYPHMPNDMLAESFGKPASAIAAKAAALGLRKAVQTPTLCAGCPHAVRPGPAQVPEREVDPAPEPDPEPARAAGPCTPTPTRSFLDTAIPTSLASLEGGPLPAGISGIRRHTLGDWS